MTAATSSIKGNIPCFGALLSKAGLLFVMAVVSVLENCLSLGGILACIVESVICRGA
jgi:hypothetical protein